MIDLKAVAGDRYRVGKTEEYDAEYLEFRKADPARFMQIPCSDGQFIRARRRGPSPRLRSSQHTEWFPRTLGSIFDRADAKTSVRAELEAFVDFHPRDLDAVAKLLRAKRKRVLTPEQAEELRLAGGLPLQTTLNPPAERGFASK